MTEKHSPLPYSLVDDGETFKIKDADGHSILSMFNVHLNGRRRPGEVLATAQLLVRAVNGLPEAIAALEVARDLIKDVMNYGGASGPAFDCGIAEIDAAITKLKG